MRHCVPKGKKDPLVYDQRFMNLNEFAEETEYTVRQIMSYLIKNRLITNGYRPSRPMLQEGLAVTDENVKGNNLFDRFVLTSDGVFWLKKQIKKKTECKRKFP